MSRVSVVRRAVCVSSLAAFLTACSSESPATSAPVAGDPAADAAEARGEAIVSGRSPVTSGGLPPIVILEPKEPREFPPQTAPPVMDQISQTFSPGLLFVRTGEPADFRNSDEILHNIRVRHDETKEAAFNIALPTGGSFTYAFQKDGFYDVGCDIHPAMAAVVIASKSPYTALANPDGTFTIENVPAGDYTLTAYVDVQKIDRPVSIIAGRTDLGDIRP